MDAQWFKYLRASATATEPPRVGADDGPAHGSPWTMQVVKPIIKCSGEMQNDLCGQRLVGNFREWCDTPLIRKPGFSTTDGCWLFDERASVSWCLPRITTCTSPCHTPPATLSWPLTRIGCWSSSALPSSTTRPPWSASSLQYACRCEARAFITVGPGGVGQSLDSCLIANLFGGSHGFMDMNVFCSLDESHVHHPGHENSHCPVFFLSDRAHRVFLKRSSHGQEAPQHRQTAQRRPSQEGGERDPVAARLPYAILTKMVAFSGWKRFEMNETLKFHGVTEMTFPSTVRRSLIINCKGRFASAQRLASLSPAPRGTSSCRT